MSRLIPFSLRGAVLVAVVSGCGSDREPITDEAGFGSSFLDAATVEGSISVDGHIAPDASRDGEGGSAESKCELEQAISIGTPVLGLWTDLVAHRGDLYLMATSELGKASLWRVSAEGAPLKSTTIDASQHFSLASSEGDLLVVSHQNGDLLVRWYNQDLIEVRKETIVGADPYDHYLRPRALESAGETYVLFARQREGEAYFEELWMTAVLEGGLLEPTLLSEVDGTEVDDFEIFELEDGRVIATWETESSVSFVQLDGEKQTLLEQMVSMSASTQSFDALAIGNQVVLAGSWAVSGSGVSGNELNLARVSFDGLEPLKKVLNPRHRPFLTAGADGFWIATQRELSRFSPELAQIGDSIWLTEGSGTVRGTASINNDLWITFATGNTGTRQNWLQRVRCN